MLAVVRLRLVGLALAVDDVVPPLVAALVPLDLALRALHDEDRLDGGLVVAVRDRGVDRGLERGRLAATELTVGGDDDLGVGVGDAGVQRLGGEAAEDDRVRGAEPGAGEHREDGLGDHRQVDRDAVAGADAERGEGVGGLGDLLLEVRVRDGAGVAPFALEVDGDPVAVAGLDVPVDAVVGDVELAADEPLREGGVAPVERRVEVLGPGDPLTGLLRPETLEVGLCLRVERLLAVGLGGELGAGCVALRHVSSSLSCPARGTGASRCAAPHPAARRAGGTTGAHGASDEWAAHALSGRRVPGRGRRMVTSRSRGAV